MIKSVHNFIFTLIIAWFYTNILISLKTNQITLKWKSTFPCHTTWLVDEATVIKKQASFYMKLVSVLGKIYMDFECQTNCYFMTYKQLN